MKSILFTFCGFLAYTVSASNVGGHASAHIQAHADPDLVTYAHDVHPNVEVGTVSGILNHIGDIADH